MFTKSILAAAAFAVALPFTAFAAGPNDGLNDGRAMQAALLNVDPAAFTTNELARIDAETSDQAKAERAAQILSEKSGATVSTSGNQSLSVEYVHHGRDDA